MKLLNQQNLIRLNKLLDTVQELFNETISLDDDELNSNKDLYSKIEEFRDELSSLYNI